MNVSSGEDRRCYGHYIKEQFILFRQPTLPNTIYATTLVQTLDSMQHVSHKSLGTEKLAKTGLGSLIPDSQIA